MNELISTVFKISAHVKFTNTDCDYQGICLLIKNTGLFNIKQKTSNPYKFGDDLISNIYRDEIFLFKEITITIVQSDSLSDFHIPVSHFSSDMYIKNLENIYNLCTQQQDVSFFKKGSYILRSFVIDNYMEDKNKADTYFLLRKYGEAYKIYCKYQDYNDFSHYCIEMSFYCNPKYSDIPFHFIDTFYYNRLIYLLFKSGAYDYLCYRLFSMSSHIRKDIMHELGRRFYNTVELKRKGIELMYFYGTKNLEYSDIYKRDALDNGILNSVNSIIEDFQDLFVVDQYEDFNIKFQTKCKGEYTFKGIKQNFDNLINLRVKFKRVGMHCKDFTVKTDKVYYMKLFFAVQERFKIDIFANFKLQGLIFLSIRKVTDCEIKIKSKEPFSVTNGDILKIYKEEILGLTDDFSINETSDGILNDPIFTDLNFKDFLVGNLNVLNINIDTILRLDRYKKHKIELLIEEKKYKIYLKNKLRVKRKLFIFIFNSYVLNTSTKINILINNYKGQKNFLEITSPSCTVIDTDFVINPKISTLYEMRCQNLHKGVSFDVKIKNESGNYVDYELITDLIF